LTSQRSPIVFLPGAGGAAPNLSLLREGPADDTRFAPISYPGWKRYVADDFSPDALIQELSEQIIAIVPTGPIAMLGISLGGHLCYAVALRLRSLGREVAGICAIDSFMVSSAAPNRGWVRRALSDALHLLKRRQFREFIRHLFSKFWRALMRLAGGRLAGLIRRFGTTRAGLSDAKSGSLFEFELSMRLLIRALAPWLATLDRNPSALRTPAALLRTALTRDDDAAWRQRCPNIEIFEITGGHQTLFDPENIDALRAAFSTATQAWRLT
jgi:thioesterase domain-containing protein